MERRIRSVEAGSGGFLFVGSVDIPETYSGADVSWVAKISEEGTITWQLRKGLLGDVQGGYGETATDVYRMGDGRYLIRVGRYHRVGLVRIDETGTIEWNREFNEASEFFVTDEDSILVSEVYGPGLTRITAEGTIKWAREYSSTNLPDQVLEGENGFLVARWGSENILEMLRDDGTRRWWRTYDQRYTVTHAEGGGYVLFGTDTVIKIDADGTTEWERPLYAPTDIEHLYHLDDGGYLLGGGGWIALRENLGDGIAVLPDVNGDGNPSQDPDDDGLYEDVNGDSSVDVGDAQALYNNRDSGAIQINGELYDFNNDETVNVGDAQALFAEVTEDD
ncbi:dockerin type I domain-containing protein [Salinirubellus sp. GCM10025818]|uniref:dockerin type I domain-containing protein n=1 Tax=Salinirubellus TaxID=2162630 RepID=UPI0030D0C11D